MATIRAATPYLILRGAAAGIEFYREAFGAVEVTRMEGPDGQVAHAELRFGAATVYLADEFPESPEQILAPPHFGGSPVIIDLEVDDVAAVASRAVAAGAVLARPPTGESEGVESAKVVDPFGHVWLLTRAS